MLGKIRSSTTLIAGLLILSSFFLGCDSEESTTDTNNEYDYAYGSLYYEAGSDIIETSTGNYLIAGLKNINGNPGNFQKGYILNINRNGVLDWHKNPQETYDCVEVIELNQGGFIFLIQYWISGHVGLLKLDQDGNQEWITSYSPYTKNGYTFIGRSFKRTEDGGYIITGIAEIDYDSDTRIADYDIFLLKTDSSGTELWRRKYGGPYEDEGYSIDLTDDGGFIITGKWEPDDELGEVMFLLKTDAEGNEQWLKKDHHYLEYWGRSVVQTQDGGFFVVAQDCGWELGLLCYKFDSLGEEEWSLNSGTQTRGIGIAFDGIQTDSGEYIVAGTLRTASDNHRNHVAVLKIDSAGNEQWLQTYNLSQSDYDSIGDIANAIHETEDNHFILTGTMGYRFSTQNGATYGDVFLMKIDPDGTLIDLATDGAY